MRKSFYRACVLCANSNISLIIGVYALNHKDALEKVRAMIRTKIFSLENHLDFIWIRSLFFHYFKNEINSKAKEVFAIQFTSLNLEDCVRYFTDTGTNKSVNSFESKEYLLSVAKELWTVNLEDFIIRITSDEDRFELNKVEETIEIVVDEDN